MTWSDIRGHEAIRERFRRSIAAGRLASSFLFVGPAGVGKRTFALKLAQALLCQTRSEDELNACGHCPACLQVAAGSHPDLRVVGRPPDKSAIPVELLIGDREHRMQEGLCHDIALKPYAGGRKIAIIDDADDLQAEGANCLLKTLEEPPPRSVLILIGTSEQRQLPTIRSRCQIVRFSPLAHKDVTELLLEAAPTLSRAEAEAAAMLADGSVAQAIVWSDPVLREFRERIWAALADGDAVGPALAQEVAAFVEEAGSEAPQRRARLRVVVRVASGFFRQLLRASADATLPADTATGDHLRQARIKWPASREVAADCLDRCLDTEAQIDANAQPATILECWLDDLARLRRRGANLGG